MLLFNLLMLIVPHIADLGARDLIQRAADGILFRDERTVAAGAGHVAELLSLIIESRHGSPQRYILGRVVAKVQRLSDG